jgi:non-homologous end joining protein Ku
MSRVTLAKAPESWRQFHRQQETGIAQDKPEEYFGDIPDHVVDTMAGHFDPETPRPKATTNLMDALRASLDGTQKRPPAASVHRRSAGRRRKPAARHKVRRRAS